MKKILFVLAFVLISLQSFCQTSDASDSTLQMSTYQTNFTYTFDTQNEEIIQMSPGKLLDRAGKLKINAIEVGLISAAAAMAITIPTACNLIDHVTGYAIGGVIALVGGVVCLSLEIKSYKLIREAGRRMTLIEIKGNGVNIKF